MFACKKSKEELVIATPPVAVTVLKHTFVSNAHVTSGTVKIAKDANNKLLLLFENFKTDGGPDLRVWLSPNNSASTYQEVGLLKGTSGSFSYELGAAINYTTNNRVLIWCEDFSVLFGHAVL